MHIRAMEAGGRRNTIYFTATLLALFIITSSPLSNAEDFDYPSIVKPPHSWTNLAPSDISFWESAGVRPILLNETFVCGFHCKFEGTACVFAISIFQSSSNDNSSFSPQMVWSANRNNPVGRGAKLQLSQGDLALQDVDSALVWSTKTAGKFVTGLKLTHQGNLMLIDRNNGTVWQSFDHPTNSLVVGQRLVSGQKLKSNMSAISWSEGIYTFLIDDDGHFVAYMESNATVYKGSNANLRYYQSDSPQSRSQTGQFYAELSNVSFGVGLSPGPGVSLIQLGSDGHLRSFGWVDSNWKEVYDLFEYHLDPCDYPLACGNYGICTAGGSCSCRYGNPFSGFINSLQPHDGCDLDERYIPTLCESPHQQSLYELNDFNITFSAFTDLLNSYSNRSGSGTDIESCKQACSNNCSCKYVVFVHNENFSSSGLCIFGSEGLSFRRVESGYNPLVFLKVRDDPDEKRDTRGIILGWTLGLPATFILVLMCIYFLVVNKTHSKDVEEDYLSHISGLPLRFSYEELKVATNNFSNKLGEGGFGYVFQGTLPGGAEVAVKCLDGFGSVKKSFMAEVETIGSIHHFNLVQLVGFCAEKSHMLLVYEYMCKGSLDQWIFCRDKALSLGWKCRRKIILDIANGLAYLHGRCRQKIIHLDVKPQNILLDENFSAKVSDFGLSKLVEREQSHVVTKMRGTPGYMAPEWLNSVITEKVDVYSFGIVVLEILCGRKNVDRSQPEEDSHLVSLFKRKVEDGELLDLVDKYNEEMQSNAAEVVQMMKVAAWCLQDEYAKRPSMSIVLTFLEGKMDGENEYDFSNPPAGAEVVTLEHQMDAVAATASSLIPSILSGPR